MNIYPRKGRKKFRGRLSHGNPKAREFRVVLALVPLETRPINVTRVTT